MRWRVETHEEWKARVSRWQRRFAYLPTHVQERNDGPAHIIWWEWYERRWVSGGERFDAENASLVQYPIGGSFSGEAFCRRLVSGG